jgi:hypothetical protein
MGGWLLREAMEAASVADLVRVIMIVRLTALLAPMLDPGHFLRRLAPYGTQK